MYMRLWWKDARQFWPIWAFLMLSACATQLLFHHYASTQAQEAFLVPLAMGWTFLYAYAVGAAAFAGERETGTLRLLDLLPASRRVVWTGKVSFAFVTTAALALVLLALAALDVPEAVRRSGIRGDAGPIQLGALLLQGLAWGLLCSSILHSALFAAVASIGVTAIVRFLMADRVPDPYALLAWELAVTPAVLAASLVVFTWGRRSRRVTLAALSAAAAAYGLTSLAFFIRAHYSQGPYSPLDWVIAVAPAALVASLVFLAWRGLNRGGRLGLQLRSPIEMTWVEPPREGLERPRPPIEAPAAPATLSIAAPAPGRIAGSAIWSADQPRPRSWFAELRFLTWQTMREGRATWLVLLAIGLICPAILIRDGGSGNLGQSPLPSTCNGIIALVAGVSVFGLENRRRTHRFLVHHGTRPGVVWLAELATWCFGLSLIWGPLGYLVVQDPGPPSSVVMWRMIALSLPLGFAFGVLCGMAIPRGITAGLVALVLLLFFALGAVGLVQVGMLPAWGMLVVSAAVLAVTWAWSGDWLLDRPAPGRWVRLGLLLSVMLATLLPGYAGWRAWSIPDVGPIATPIAWAAASVPLPPDRNAAELYREAGRLLESLNPRQAPTPSRGASGVPFDLDAHPDLLDLIRRAAARPDCRFFDPDRITLRNLGGLPPMRELANAVVTHARGRLTRGDLDAAWDDIELLFRMARHLDQGAVTIQALHALAIEKRALDLAVEWANDPRQAPDRLRAAMLAYLALPPMTPAAEVVRAEGILVERAIRLPADDLKDLLLEANGWAARDGSVPLWAMLWLDLISTPWERTRAVRLTRWLTSEKARLAAVEPWQRSLNPPSFPAGESYREGERLALVGLLLAHVEASWTVNDNNEVARRSIVQVMAVREWQIRHGGQFPDRLDLLVPDVLRSLPLDPYSGRPFGYTTFAQAEVYRQSKWPQVACSPETRLIYSVGPDGKDDHGLFLSTEVVTPGDIVFPVFPLPAGKK